MEEVDIKEAAAVSASPGDAGRGFLTQLVAEGFAGARLA
jgi:hypothetical protein